jgi:hypothetical protein
VSHCHTRLWGSEGEQEVSAFSSVKQALTEHVAAITGPVVRSLSMLFRLVLIIAARLPPPQLRRE